MNPVFFELAEDAISYYGLREYWHSIRTYTESLHIEIRMNESKSGKLTEQERIELFNFIGWMDKNMDGETIELFDIEEHYSNYLNS